MFTFVVFLLILLGLSPLAGELLRIPVAGFDALPSDLLLPVIFGTWLVYKWRQDRAVRVGAIGKSLLLFTGVLLLTFLLNAFRFPLSEMTSAAAYLLRLVFYLSLYFIVYDLFKNKRYPLSVKRYLWFVTIAATLLAVIGFIQLLYFPSFLDLGLDLYGWDPHHHRLFATWFDPNFVAGFLAFGVGLAGALFFLHSERAKRLWVALFGFLMITAIYFTFSRSGYLALLVTLFIGALLRSRKLLLVFLIVFLLGLTASERFQERVTSGLHSAQTLMGLDTQYALDPTARLRVDSWRYAREIIGDHPFIGIGYNRYPFEVNQRGYLQLSNHASGGSDSSLLTLWATTGLFGLLAYLLIFVIAARDCVRLIQKKNPFGTGLLASLAGLLLHSIFVNSLLLPWMMIYLWSSLGALAARAERPGSGR